MGIITGLLVASGYLATFHVPFWVIICSHIAIAMGTLLRRVENCEDDGTKSHEVKAVRRILRGNCRRSNVTRYGIRRNKRQHDSYYYGSDHGSRSHKKAVCGPLGGSGENRSSVDFDNTTFCYSICLNILGSFSPVSLRGF